MSNASAFRAEFAIVTSGMLFNPGLMSENTTQVSDATQDALLTSPKQSTASKTKAVRFKRSVPCAWVQSLLIGLSVGFRVVWPCGKGKHAISVCTGGCLNASRFRACQGLCNHGHNDNLQTQTLGARGWGNCSKVAVRL